MSAVFGLFDPETARDAPRARRDLEALSRALEPFGPDGGGTSLDGDRAAGLGHKMLRVTPEDALERMPHEDEASGIVITADARLDNRDDLCRALSLESRDGVDGLPDSRLIIAAYNRWGTDCPSHLLGDFAFAIWDPREQRLFCARDHMGVRPFFYFHRDGRFVFASDLRALLATPGLPRELDAVAMRELLVYGDVPGTSHTMWKYVWRLPPAHALTVSRSGLAVRSFWSLDTLGELRLASDDLYRERLRELLVEAIRCRLRSAFPVGAHLTGGLDSSSVAVLAARELRARGEELETFSWAPPLEGEDDGSGDERRHVIEVCRAAGLRCHYTTVSVEEAIAFKRRDPSVEPVETLRREHVVERKAAAMGIRLLLSGWGGDELVSFNGRGYFAELAAALEWRTLLRELYLKAKLDKAGWRRFPELLSQLTSRVVEPFLPARILSLVHPAAIVTPVNDFVSDQLASITRHDDWLPREPGRELRSVRRNQLSLARDGHLQRRMEHWAVSGGEQGVGYAYPLLDKRLVEFALQVPVRLFFKDGWKRHLYRWSMEGILPECVQWNPTKDEPSLQRQAASLRRSIRSALGPTEASRLPESHPYVAVTRIGQSGRRRSRLRKAREFRRLEGQAVAARVLLIDSDGTEEAGAAATSTPSPSPSRARRGEDRA